jgi:hypothetical protein
VVGVVLFPTLAEQLVKRPIEFLALFGAVANGTAAATGQSAVVVAHDAQECGILLVRVGHCDGLVEVEGCDEVEASVGCGEVEVSAFWRGRSGCGLGEVKVDSGDFRLLHLERSRHSGHAAFT